MAAYFGTEVLDGTNYFNHIMRKRYRPATHPSLVDLGIFIDDIFIMRLLPKFDFWMNSALLQEVNDF